MCVDEIKMKRYDFETKPNNAHKWYSWWLWIMCILLVCCLLILGNGERRKVKNVFDPGYTFDNTHTTGTNDIMLVQLDDDLPFSEETRPICLPEPIRVFGKYPLNISSINPYSAEFLKIY